MRNFLFICLLLSANHLTAQILQTEQTKVSPEQIVDFKYTDCQSISESTLPIDKFPHSLQLLEPVERLNARSFLPMSIFHAPAPKGDIYKFRHGFVRGDSHLTIPLPESGIYFVRLQSHSPTLLIIDAQTLMLKIRCYENCPPSQ